MATAVAMIWGVNFVVIDEGLAGAPPLLFVAIRFTIVIFPAIFLVPRPAVPFRDVAVVGLFMCAGGELISITALGRTVLDGLQAVRDDEAAEGRD